ncbi:DMT family transporter [Falsiphaeobacter marinintestinus]|uniref:DMT family transporter n=1 Tax=Falsiphaeobacter marinintestinus TaxID=1492905 RepID=UPI001FE25E06|nr:DMT family transporter [Phaeobacter marinintestinus]
MDASGTAIMIAFAAMLAFNQVVIKVTGGGFGPVFQAGLRSAFGLVVLLIWMRARNVPLSLPRNIIGWGILGGVLFAIEFLFLYIAIDLTAVSRASIMLYSMPVWLGLAAHVWLPGERLNAIRWTGLMLAMGGVILALLDRSAAGGNLLGDVLALLAAFCWAGIALVVRMTPLSKSAPEVQLWFQLVVSAPVLLILSPFFGDFIRDLAPIHFAGLAFQAICIASLGFLLWFWLMSVYRASSVASFSFLSPVLAVVFGWLLLGESIGLQVWIALGLVAIGVVLINRK